VQLAGREARWMGEGARAAESAGADIIDINMGCPAKKVTSGYSGSALMRDLDHALTLIEATVAATSRPVTLKMRLGWDENSINAPALARRAVDAGVCLITVHGRTRCQFYSGKADWSAVGGEYQSGCHLLSPQFERQHGGGFAGRFGADRRHCNQRAVVGAHPGSPQ
jgi:tRNA-dihydrouridine synthase